jgi:hypothetical protein
MFVRACVGCSIEPHKCIAHVLFNRALLSPMVLTGSPGRGGNIAGLAHTQTVMVKLLKPAGNPRVRVTAGILNKFHVGV